jgi:hypothetical protein
MYLGEISRCDPGTNRPKPSTHIDLLCFTGGGDEPPVTGMFSGPSTLGVPLVDCWLNFPNARDRSPPNSGIDVVRHPGCSSVVTRGVKVPWLQESPKPQGGSRRSYDLNSGVRVLTSRESPAAKSVLLIVSVCVPERDTRLGDEEARKMWMILSRRERV